MSKKAKAEKKPAATGDKGKLPTVKAVKKAAPKSSAKSNGTKPAPEKKVDAKRAPEKKAPEKKAAVKKAAKPVALQSVSPKRERVTAIEVPELNEAVLSVSASTVPAPIVPFAESREAAIDALLQQIEAAEARLTAVKRATNDEELQTALAQ